MPDAERNGKKVRIVTAKGEIVVELFGDEAPKTVSNFLTLAKDGFYNGLTFHRREEGFVIQGGDPNGNGTGGPGYQFADEPVKRSYTKGILAMANSGPNTNGSQFFIMLSDYPLPPLYTVFGAVVSGQDVVDRIQVGDAMDRVTVE
ncbi:MAG: peptidylprolyl isomerase [bacterium]|nr:peptidylprolyl isomerase [bacterium]